MNHYIILVAYDLSQLVTIYLKQKVERKEKKRVDLGIDFKEKGV